MGYDMGKNENERRLVFVSYSHHDKQWVEKLTPHLKPLARDGIEVWDDTRIRPGMEWQEEIKAALAKAKIAVLLVSADFLASEFVTQHELPRLLEAAKNGGATILPIIVRKCLFEQTPELFRFQAVNDPAKPLNALSEAEQDDVFLQVALEVLANLPDIAERDVVVPEREVLVFETSKQKIHLKTSERGIECHLADNRQGKGGHQWTLSAEQASDILRRDDVHVNPNYKESTGLFTLGARRDWLYSKKLFPKPVELKNELKTLLRSVTDPERT